jgi:hypothetical protein
MFFRFASQNGGQKAQTTALFNHESPLFQRKKLMYIVLNQQLPAPVL